MLSPIALLLTTSLVTVPATPARAADDTTIAAQAATQSPAQDDPMPQPTPTERPHQVGLGGFGGSGGGVSFRYFMNDRIGVDMNVGWSLPAMGGARQNGSSGTSFRAAPSAMLMLTKSHQLADLDVRPYIGGGVNYSATPSSTQTLATGQVRNSGVGMQAFGGAEFSFASAPSISISAQVAYYHLAVQPINLATTSGTDFYVLFHYYMR
jgi:outer membrane protein W